MSRLGPDHERWQDVVAAYALGAVDDAERAGFEAHLGACRACAEELADLRVAADFLPQAAPQVAVPPDLKARIMAVVEAEAATLAAAEPARAPGPAAPAREPAAPPRRAPRRPWWRMDFGRLALAGAVGVVLLVVGALGGAALSGGGAVESRQVVAQVDAAQAPGARAILEVDADGTAQLVGTRMPDAAAGRVHQVWIQRRGEDAPRPTAALFLPRSDGSARVAVPGDMDDVQAVMVTSEPKGGSAAPTTDPWLVVSPA